MLCIASALDAIDFIDVLIPMVTHLHLTTTSAGRDYAEQILPFVPRYFILQDRMQSGLARGRRNGSGYADPQCGSHRWPPGPA